MYGGKHIVGRKTETYLTAERLSLSPRRAQSSWEITRHTIVHELHATKGWRKISHHRKVQTRFRPPTIGEWRDVTTFQRTMPRKKRPSSLKRPTYWVHHHAIEDMRERHGWWRRLMDRLIPDDTVMGRAA